VVADNSEQAAGRIDHELVNREREVWGLECLRMSVLFYYAQVLVRRVLCAEVLCWCRGS